METKIKAKAAKQEELLLKLKADRQANCERMETKMEAILMTMDTIREKMIANHKAIMVKLNTHQEETETESNPRMMPSAEEHHEIPNGEATVSKSEDRGCGGGSTVWPWSAARRSRKGPGKLMD
jgi:hypothetical protein